MDEKMRKRFEYAMENMRYAEVLNEFLSRYKKETFDEELACALGMLLDHEALKCRGFKKIFLEHKAKKIYKQILKRKIDSICALLGLGRIYWHKNSPEALFYYMQALKIKPNDPSILTSVANAFKSIGDIAQAEKYYEAAISTRNASFGTFLNYAKMLTSLNRCEKALILINEAKNQISFLPPSENKNIALDTIGDIEKKCSASLNARSN